MIGKDFGGWKNALDRYGKSAHRDVQKIRVLDACDFNSGDGIDTLVNKSLLTVDSQNKCLEMHDLIQDMGKEIAKEEAWAEIGECSRLWFHEDVLQVHVDDMISDRLMLDPPQREEINCTDTVFAKMKNLRILIVRNMSFSHESSCLSNNLRLLDWKNYPSQSFPSEFYPRKIGAFNLSRFPVIALEEPFKLTNVSIVPLDIYAAKVFLNRVSNFLKSIAINNRYIKARKLCQAGIRTA
ncbi:hypothetical protein V8G54_023845 [Vigna mungo]|uniref:Disease resistance protein Roq1-like winged-helix domain-containing protein n=1 Tax=Vigna mungo TaxID=3915 RepID=A0AAQ3RPK6_VIGMU